MAPRKRGTLAATPRFSAPAQWSQAQERDANRSADRAGTLLHRQQDTRRRGSLTLLCHGRSSSHPVPVLGLALSMEPPTARSRLVPPVRRALVFPSCPPSASLAAVEVASIARCADDHLGVASATGVVPLTQHSRESTARYARDDDSAHCPVGRRTKSAASPPESRAPAAPSTLFTVGPKPARTPLRFRRRSKARWPPALPAGFGGAAERRTIIAFQL
jgi:hypothetical protein